jgi:hypothetical protein
LTFKEATVNQQLPLPLLNEKRADSALRKAWAQSGLRVPYHIALQIPPLSICLRNLAEAQHAGSRHV